MTSDSHREIRAARAVLAALEPGRNATLHDLLTRLGPAGALAWLAAPSSAAADRTAALGGLSIDELQTRAAAVHEATRQAGARVLIPEDDHWPARLDDLVQVPFAHAGGAALCLWVRGHSHTDLQQMLAVTGSRAATAYGVHVAGELARGLAEAGWTVTATGGYGIDAAAVRAALAVHGRVVAVLPGGIDRLYPAGNSHLLEQVAATGLLISAYPPGTAPTRQRFAGTARLLAAMTTGTVVVEAGLRSGALTALDEALGRGRTAMVVPGPVTSAVSAGIHEALRRHLQIRVVRNTTDVLTDLGPAAAQTLLRRRQQ